MLDKTCSQFVVLCIVEFWKTFQTLVFYLIDKTLFNGHWWQYFILSLSYMTGEIGFSVLILRSLTFDHSYH